MARSSSKKAPGSLRMTISGTVAEMARIKAVAADRDKAASRLIHDAVADYADKSDTTESALSYVHGDDIDEIKSLLSEIIARQAQAGIDAKSIREGGVPKQLDEVLQILTTLSQAVHRELPERGKLLDQPPIYSLPALEAVQMVCALLYNLVETGKFEVNMGEAMKKTVDGQH